MKAILLLEDGRSFVGKSFGASGEVIGEVVFNTSMAGYQEIITDPSYQGQIVTMTYPLIGNYGMNQKDMESKKPFIKAFIVKETSNIYSNYRADCSLQAFFKTNNIIGLEDIDTRALVRHIRVQGAMQGIISTEDFDKESLLKKVKEAPSIVGKDLVCEVTTASSYIWGESTVDNTEFINPYFSAKNEKNSFNIVAYDFGIKHNILRLLIDHGGQVTVVPAATPAQEILAMNPDGIFLSNGPGDPSAVTYAINNLKQLLNLNIPIFGICLGHQLMSLALGAQTYKLKFGHRGGNHPVMDMVTKKVEITSQNHGFAVDEKSLAKTELELTHINLNDHTVEGVQHKTKPFFSVQYHPEASPGPHDSNYLFARFFDNIKNYKFNGK
ncbi:MAG: carbamoyl phosphate synthase small subunit [Candidatus Margulisiibacteriota bacterium]|nr:MAG: carbamoyl phosphate synthase small subunit [Candidatus Margulisbacteria bacterium GWD2_39_127]OGI03930.1 MAG: carbamoyl phosphate synthase small subunit [Candidatus Margulisbacteria bacterium GWF2_38_17]OGI08200.1 MAG: carbamoyl phosphate synthase small subunit [Candidatus Margulisbacteria bacterium GWE2_39_32]PZM79671.1 MAG: carbamoyl phosphate synthase small subunit [Candidatus Margulisiibacteriota bacterium]HAR61937.1 carbamoyl phosphate synthase small subunit [Candidatus Margulisiib